MTKTKQEDSIPVPPVFCIKDNDPQIVEHRTEQFKRELMSKMGEKKENIQWPEWVLVKAGGWDLWNNCHLQEWWQKAEGQAPGENKHSAHFQRREKANSANIAQ